MKALPDDFEPMQAGSIMYFRSKGRYYVAYLDPSGEELYVVVDPPAGAVPAVPARPRPAAAAPAKAARPGRLRRGPPAAKPKAVTLTARRTRP